MEFAEAAVAVPVWVVLPALLPDQLQGQVFVRLQLFADLRPVRLWVFPPNRERGSLRKQCSFDLLVIPVLRQGPLYAGRLRGRQVLVDGALRYGATTGDLVLAHSEGMEPQNFFQFAHGQPFLWQLGVSTYHWSPAPPLPYAAVPISCRSPFRTTTVKLIAISSEH